MKKTLPIFFSLALVCCSFTACGDKDNNKSATQNPSVARDDTSGLNSATDASIADSNNNVGNDNVDRNNRDGIVDNVVTDARGLVDDLVSTGEDVVNGAGNAIEGAGDAIMGTTRAGY